MIRVPAHMNMHGYCSRFHSNLRYPDYFGLCYYYPPILCSDEEAAVGMETDIDIGADFEFELWLASAKDSQIDSYSSRTDLNLPFAWS